MDAKSAEKLYRPELVEGVKSFLGGETPMERELVFPSLRVLLEVALDEDGLCEEIIFHHICIALEFLRINDGLNIAALYGDILKIINVVYPASVRVDRNKKLTKQLLVLIHKLDSKIKGN